MTDFRVTSYGTVVNIKAVSKAAKDFANENLPVEGWMGLPTDFTTDHRAAFNLADRLAGEGWEVEMP